jgi:two-component system, NtrC family, response regulator HydG
MSYSWPGNVRELEHVMEHAFVLCPGGAITLNHLPADIRNREWSAVHHPKADLRPSLSAQEIRDALRRSGWNKAKAARLLKIGRRTITARSRPTGSQTKKPPELRLRGCFLLAFSPQS